MTNPSVLHSAVTAFFIILQPHRMIFLFGGVCMGLTLGLTPGIGGLAGTAMLLPFTYAMDPSTAFALLLGLGATTTTADPISAIVLGAPGHSASAATAIDGYQMTIRGEGSRALGAAYMSALIGGLFGALLLGLVLPIVRPIVLMIGSPELLGLALFGISMVSSLTGNTPLRGMASALFGIMLAMIGSDPQTGTLRWTLNSLYLWEGLPLVPMVLGIYALPELADLLVAKKTIVHRSDMKTTSTKQGLLLGIKDVFTHWWLVLRVSWIGSAMGMIPGISVSSIDWISYGHALKTEKDAQKTFGAGDVRGVIAAEGATNSREGGALVPTVVFGVPSSAGMAILLGAFLMHGLVPGPDMLTKNLDITYAMVWSLAFANILGSGLCFLFSSQFAKLSSLRYSLILPPVLALIYVGAFEGKREWGDLYSLLFFGVLGWALKHFKWPRPPMVLGFILGGILERYMFISIQRYGMSWMLRPIVIVLFVLSASAMFRPFIQDLRSHGGFRGIMADYGVPRFRGSQLFPLFLLGLFSVMMAQAFTWNFYARIVPTIVGFGAITFTALSLINDIFRDPAKVAVSMEKRARQGIGEKIHMDIGSNIDYLPVHTVLARGAMFFGWLVFFLCSMAFIGLIPTVPVFIIAFMRIEGKEPWRITLPMAIIMVLFNYLLFDQLIAVPWPNSVVGGWLPFLKNLVPSM